MVAFHLLGIAFKAEIKRCGLFFFLLFTQSIQISLLFLTFFLFHYQLEEKKNRFSVYLNGAASIVKLFYLMQSITCMACGFRFRCGAIYKCPQRKTTRHKFFAQEIKNQKRATERTREEKTDAIESNTVNAFIVHCA